MSADTEYGSGPAGPIRRWEGRQQQSSWWWNAGVRIYPRNGMLYAWRVGYTGMPLDATVVDSGQPLETWIPTDWETLAMSLLRKSDMDGRAGSGPRPLTDPGFAGPYPLLWSFLTQNKWEDGSARQTSSVLMFSDDGVLKLMLRDRDAGLCLWVAAGTVMGLFDAVEAALGDPRADWRQDRVKPGDQASRVRKGR